MTVGVHITIFVALTCFVLCLWAKRGILMVDDTKYYIPLLAHYQPITKLSNSDIPSNQITIILLLVYSYSDWYNHNHYYSIL